MTDATPNTKTLMIQGESFEVSMPYAEGHPLTAVEAKVLNQTRCENIRNNQAKAIKEAKEANTFNHEATIKIIDAYDAAYSFAMPGAGAIRRTMDPVEKEARAIARNLIASKLKEKGRTMKDAISTDKGKAKVADAIDKYAEHPKVIAAAKKVVADRAALADLSLDDA